MQEVEKAKEKISKLAFNEVEKGAGVEVDFERWEAILWHLSAEMERKRFNWKLKYKNENEQSVFFLPATRIVFAEQHAGSREIMVVMDGKKKKFVEVLEVE